MAATPDVQAYLDFYKNNSKNLPMASRRVLAEWEKGNDPQDVVARGMKEIMSAPQASHDVSAGVRPRRRSEQPQLHIPTSLQELIDTRDALASAPQNRGVMTPGQMFGAVEGQNPVSSVPMVPSHGPSIVTPEGEPVVPAQSEVARSGYTVPDLTPDAANQAALDKAQKEYGDFVKTYDPRETGQTQQRHMLLGNVMRTSAAMKGGTLQQIQAAEKEGRMQQAATANAYDVSTKAATTQGGAATPDPAVLAAALKQLNEMRAGQKKAK